MGQDVPQTILNIGCGYEKLGGYINVDAEKECDPDIVHDLNKYPWPFENDSVDHILASHIFEHLDDYWMAFKECVRILKPGGNLIVRVPSPGEDGALGSRDHKHIISIDSFDGIVNLNYRKGNNAFIRKESQLPIKLTKYELIVDKSRWYWPGFLKRWACIYLRNICREQLFRFEKI